MRRFYKAQAKIRGSRLHLGPQDQEGQDDLEDQAVRERTYPGHAVAEDTQEGHAVVGGTQGHGSPLLLLGNVSMDAGVTNASLCRALKDELGSYP